MAKRAKNKRPAPPRKTTPVGGPRGKAAAADPATAQANALVPKILAHLNQGEVQSAMQLIESGMKMAPRHPEFPHLAGQVLLGLPDGDKAEARRLLESAVRLAPTTPQYHITLGNALFMQGDLDTALRHARQAVRLDSGLALAHTSVGVVLAKLKRQREAAEAFANAARLDPKNPDAWSNVAVCRMELGDPDGVLEAVGRLERLVTDPPPELSQRLGYVYRALGRHALAQRYFRRALAKQPDLKDVWFALADVQSQAGELEAATAAISEAERLGFSECAVRYTQARISGQQGRMADAKARLAQAVRLAADNVKDLATIADEYARLGDFDAQQRCLQRVLELDPDNVDAFVALSWAPGRALDEYQIARLEKVAADTTVDAPVRSRVGFVLGDNFRYAKEFDRSFRYYRLGNRLKGFRFDEMAYRAWQERIESTFTRELFVDRQDTGHASTLPVLIVGMPRSGTTLTEQIISSHPLVMGAGEIGNVAQLANISSLEALAFDAPIDRVAHAEEDLLAGYATNLLDAMTAFAQSGETHVTNKTPHNFQQLGLFALLFPRAPIIHVKRDPRDNLVSIYFHDFRVLHEYAYDLKALGRYYRLYERLMEHWAQVIPNPIYELQYEELVEDLPGKAAELADFLGVDLDERMLRFWEQERKVETASQWQVRQPLYTSSVGRWMPYERHLKPLFEGLGL